MNREGFGNTNNINYYVLIINVLSEGGEGELDTKERPLNIEHPFENLLPYL